MPGSDDSRGEWTICAATHEDLDTLCALLARCVAHMRAHGIDQWGDVYPTRATLIADIENGAAFLASASTSVIGSVALNDVQNPEYGAVPWQITGVPIAVVHRLMVDPAHQQRGVARFLMHFAERRAATLGYGAIRLDAFSANPRALRLYEGLGYRDAGGVTFPKGPFRCFEKALA
jgi:GNAT superfamily N-acetyltransferase